MSNLKTNTDLFIGEQELDRLIKFLKDDGFVKMFDINTDKFGIVNQPVQDPTFSNLKLIQGSGPTKGTLKAGVAVDKDFNVISNISDAIDALDIAGDSVERYVFIKHITTNVEVGTLDIAANGQLTGTSTKFTEVLRGQPNFVSRIKFPNSVLNTGEYDLVDVVSDTDVTISGVLQAEVGQTYIVTGTFTPGRVVPPANKDIFVYDNFELRVNTSITHTADEEFLIARVLSDGATLTIKDYRSEYLESRATQELRSFISTNVIIGAESQKYDSQDSPRNANIVTVGWGFRSAAAAWSVDVNNQEITLTAGSGGIKKAIADVVTNELDGWRVYFGGTNNFARVITSTQTGGTVKLALRQYDVSKFPASGVGSVVVVPDCDYVQLSFTNAARPNLNVEQVFPVYLGVGDVRVNTNSGINSTIQFRQFWGKNVSDNALINDGDFYTPAAFDNTGTLTGATTDAVVAGVMTMVQNGSTHESRIGSIEGDAGIARRDEVNTFSETQHLSQGTDIDVAGVDQIVTPTDGNQFELDNYDTPLNWMTTQSIGTRITLTASVVATLTNFVTAGRPVGFSPLIFNENGTSADTMDLQTSQGYTFEMVPFSTYGLWSYVGMVGSELKRKLEDEWTDVPVVLADVESNDAFAGTGTPQGALALDLAGTHFRYRKVGKTATVSILLKDFQVDRHDNTPAESITLAIPLAIQSLLTPKNPELQGITVVNALANTAVDNPVVDYSSAVPSKFVFQNRNSIGLPTLWNRLYDFSSSVSRAYTAVGATTIEPYYSIYATFTYETA